MVNFHGYSSPPVPRDGQFLTEHYHTGMAFLPPVRYGIYEEDIFMETSIRIYIIQKNSESIKFHLTLFRHTIIIKER